MQFPNKVKVGYLVTYLLKDQLTTDVKTKVTINWPHSNYKYKIANSLLGPLLILLVVFSYVITFVLQLLNMYKQAN